MDSFYINIIKSPNALCCLTKKAPTDNVTMHIKHYEKIIAFFFAFVLPDL